MNLQSNGYLSANREVRTIARQRGAFTVLTGVLVLLLMTALMLYTTRAGIFNQRSAANDVRAKIAFNLAETVSDAATELLIAEREQVATEWVGNGTWTPCPDGATSGYCQDLYPDFSGFYIHDLGAARSEFLDAMQKVVPAQDPGGNAVDVTATARVSAVFSYITLDSTTGNVIEIGSPSSPNDIRFVATMYGYGFADCTDTDNSGFIEDDELGTCRAEARVAKPLSTNRILAGAPNVPVTSKPIFNPNARGDIVANPNGGGVGVPVSVWGNANPAIGGSSETFNNISGAFRTCHAEDYYGVLEEWPEDGPEFCRTGNGNCACDDEIISAKDNTGELTYGAGCRIDPTGALDCAGGDLLEDTLFPDDLFRVYFGTNRNNYLTKKSQADLVIQPNQCGTLDENSSGLIWVEQNARDTCRIGAQQVIGSTANPVIMVVTSDLTLVGGSNIHGLVYVFAQPGQGIPEFDMAGTASIWGALVVDTDSDPKFLSGTGNVIYDASILARTAGFSGINSVAGGWRDFDVPAYGPQGS